MRYHHTFQVTAPLEAVADFHAQSSSMPAITPPPVIVQVHQAPDHLTEGDTMDFTLWIGPMPVHWIARIEDVGPEGFTDRQLEGPFKTWIHRHTFRPLSATETEVIDQIDIEVSDDRWWRFVGYNMALQLPILFAYRAWRTKQILNKQTALAGLKG